jgi:cytochrome c-type biogenesis protein CcmH
VIRRWGAWIALALVVVVVLAVVLWPTGSPSASERAHELETQLKCPECQGLSVADSQAPTSRAIRADVARRIKAGQSDGQIRQAYVDTYGQSILLTPQGSGVSLIVWILPIVVIALGATGIVFALRRNRDQPHLHATAADERLVERQRDDEPETGDTAHA